LRDKALHRAGDLARVERVVDPPVPGQVLPELGRQRSSGSQVIRAIRTPGRRAAASTNRVVVSSRYGATNPATVMGRTYPPVTMPVMNVVFVEPFFPSNQRQFARALAEAGATVIGIGEYGVESFDDD